MHYTSVLLVLVELNGIQTFACACFSIVPCHNVSSMAPFCLNEWNSSPNIFMHIVVPVQWERRGGWNPSWCAVSPRSLRGSEVETQMDAVSPKCVTDISCIRLHFISIPVSLSAPPLTSAMLLVMEKREEVLNWFIWRSVMLFRNPLAWGGRWVGKECARSSCVKQVIGIISSSSELVNHLFLSRERKTLQKNGPLISFVSQHVATDLSACLCLPVSRRKTGVAQSFNPKAFSHRSAHESPNDLTSSQVTMKWSGCCHGDEGK